MDRDRVLATIGECAVCGRPASDMCDCCHSCNDLRRQLATANERIAERDEWCQGLGLHISNLDEQITAARREVARLRDALESIRSREHSDTCSHSLVPECACDCHVAIAEAALAKCSMTGVKC